MRLWLLIVGRGEYNEKDALLAAYTWCTVRFLLCIWPILLWGSEAAPRVKIQIYIRAFCQGHWLDIDPGYMFWLWGQTHTDTNLQASHRKEPGNWTQDLPAVRWYCQPPCQTRGFVLSRQDSLEAKKLWDKWILRIRLKGRNGRQLKSKYINKSLKDASMRLNVT